MNKLNSMSRKIRKRKRKEDNDHSTTAPPETAPAEIAPPDTAAPETTSPSKISKTEKNKKNKIKYKLKKKQHEVNSNQKTKKAPKCYSFFLTSTQHWKWKMLKSTTFTPKQKKSLFKNHNVSLIIERNKSTLLIT